MPLRRRAGGGADHPAGPGGDPGGGRAQPALALGAAAGGAQADQGAATATTKRGGSDGGPRGNRSPPRRRHGAGASRSTPASQPAPASAASRPLARGIAPAPAGRARAPMPARLVPLAVGRTAVAVSGIAESGLVRRLTRGRLWIGALTTLLVGIVALNVLALSFNATASRTGMQADALKREISILRAKLAETGASDQRVQTQAAALGLIVPEPGSITYVQPQAERRRDRRQAARRRGADRAPTARLDAVIERRIGLLFACFLLLFCFAIGRAAWVQGVQGGGLERRRPKPAHPDRDHPRAARPDPRSKGAGAGRLRGRRRRGRDPLPGRASARQPPAAWPSALHVPEADILRALADRSSGFAYLAREVDLATAERVRKLDIAGVVTVPSTRRIYPEGKLAAQVIGTSGSTTRDSPGSRPPTTTCSAPPAASAR